MGCPITASGPRHHQRPLTGSSLVLSALPSPTVGRTRLTACDSWPEICGFLHFGTPVMPRYRTISCDHCGYMQLKSDVDCDQCGRMTARAKRKMWAGLIGAGTTVLVALLFYARVKAIAVGLAPH